MTTTTENAAVSHSDTSSIAAALDPITAFSSLKRKRPPKIEIPNVLQEIKTEKQRDLAPRNGVVCFSGIGVGVSSAKGKKKFMEDAHKIVSCLQGNSKRGFFGVYDGHGGSKAAEFAAENLHTNILEMMDACTEKEEAFRAGYLKTDHEFLKQGVGSGTCCVTALVDEQEVVISNVGDCRAVLSRGGVAEALTRDHTAAQEGERQRIQDKGGYVEFHRGAWRVHGVLSVSRSIGDAHLKSWVLGEPETNVLQLTPDMEFVVLASDGLWEKVGNQEAIDMATRTCSVQKKMAPPGNGLKDNDEDHLCVSVSPSSKLRRTLLVKEPKVTQSPGELQKDNNDESGCVRHSPSSKLQRISLVKQPKGTQSPGELLIDNNEDYGFVNVSPSSKLRRISLVKQPEGMQSPGYKKTLFGSKDADNDFSSENESPPSKSRRLSMVKRVNMKTESPIKEKCGCKIRPTCGENEFASENESPPSKSRRISLVKRVNMKSESPIKENSGYKMRPASGGLVTACKELVNLALSRGSLDDITVMIIDLNHFRCNSG
ncbi:probable protein phosphatase 2C 14 [Rosa rugosa]|uniref:probable protein phosphatase 2C 14 n=1 Tax=Rosa rugosa TaxID=74645 RepID=UPI002B40ECA1|nr:probable protein phosphatase 2C 14 [Rosa rugosa]